MTLRRITPFFVIIFILAACYQQADDTFDTVNSQGSGGNNAVITPAPPTSEPVITVIVPGTGEDPTATPMGIAAGMETPTEAVIAFNAPTATLVIIQPTSTVPPAATNIPLPTAGLPTDTVPTATEQTIVTPEAVVVMAIPTATPTQIPTQTGAEALPPTPDEFVTEDGAGDEPVIAGDCEYIVQPGDNPFRISVNHDVSVDDLMALNNISPALPLIQPGQVLQIPDCVPGAEETISAEQTAEPDVTIAATPADETIHVVASGQTLLSIARQYGVTVNAILAANTDVTNPNRIVPGQELVIPPAAAADGE